MPQPVGAGSPKNPTQSGKQLNLSANRNLAERTLLIDPQHACDVRFFQRKPGERDVTTEDFRRIALSFPEATEGAHMGHPDFRVRKKIFATIWPEEGLGMVKLTPEQQRVFVGFEPAVYVPVKGGWGRRGCTNVRLEAADEESVRRAVLTAWRGTAPKGLVEEFEAED